MFLELKNTTFQSITSKILHFVTPLIITERFNTNISHQLFDYRITFMNSQCENTNSKGDFVLKNRFETSVLKISGIQKLI